MSWKLLLALLGLSVAAAVVALSQIEFELYTGERLYSDCGAVGDSEPAWSPDGRTIVFSRCDASHVEWLWAIEPDGERERRLPLRGLLGGSYPRIQIEDAAYTPREGSLGFVVDTAGASIVVATGDGTSPRILFRDAVGLHDPAWDPRGRYVAFGRTSDRLDRTDLWLLQIGGRAKRIARRTAVGHASPSWAPDGSRLAYATEEGGIAIVDRQGRAPGKVATTFAADPAWSPDGRRLAFTWQERLAIARPDGSRRRLLTPTAMAVSSPTWSPDGERLAFSVDSDSDRAMLYVVDDPGGRIRQLTDGR